MVRKCPDVFKPGHDAPEAGQRSSQDGSGHIAKSNLIFNLKIQIVNSNLANRRDLEGTATLLDGRTALRERQLDGKIPVVLCQ